jgi:hypothetical protein
MMEQAVRDAHVARVQRDGFTIVENAIEPALVDALMPRSCGWSANWTPSPR